MFTNCVKGYYILSLAVAENGKKLDTIIDEIRKLKIYKKYMLVLKKRVKIAVTMMTIVNDEMVANEELMLHSQQKRNLMNEQWMH